ncbi:hypothetical protein ACKWTF_011704 [Chironomus riparius]
MYDVTSEQLQINRFPRIQCIVKRIPFKKGLKWISKGKKMKYIIASLFFIFLNFHHSDSLSCYTCTNVDQIQCVNGKNLPLQNCTSQSYERLVNIKPVCIKIMKIKTNNSTMYHRSCEKSGPLNNYCTKQKKTFKSNVKCQLCYDELCNSGKGDELRDGSASVNFPSLLLTTVWWILLIKLCS